MNGIEELKKLLKEIADIEKKAYQSGYEKGFENGKKVKEKEYENYHRWLDAKNEELQVIRELEKDW